MFTNGPFSLHVNVVFSLFLLPPSVGLRKCVLMNLTFWESTIIFSI